MSKAAAFDSVLGRVPSGIFILTVGSGPRATGMLSSWVMQAGFEPPMISVGVKLGRYVCDWLTEGQPFVLNLVGESQTDLLKHFGKGFEPDAPAFEGLAITHCAAACRCSRTRSATSNANRFATSTRATTASSWPRWSAGGSTTASWRRWCIFGRVGRSTKV